MPAANYESARFCQQSAKHQLLLICFYISKIMNTRICISIIYGFRTPIPCDMYVWQTKGSLIIPSSVTVLLRPRRVDV